jgi:hypothetical protein
LGTISIQKLSSKSKKERVIRFGITFIKILEEVRKEENKPKENGIR